MAAPLERTVIALIVSIYVSTCASQSLFVSSSGVDGPSCGGSSNPCRSILFSRLFSSNMAVYLTSGAFELSPTAARCSSFATVFLGTSNLTSFIVPPQFSLSVEASCFLSFQNISISFTPDQRTLSLLSLTSSSASVQLLHISITSVASASSIISSSAGSISISSSTFSDITLISSAGSGAAAFLRGSSSLTITSSIFSDCTAVFGGALMFDDAATAEISRTAFVLNRGRSFGGAIEASVSSQVNVTGCSFISNTAQYSGAIDVIDSSVVLVADTLFLGNVATSGGVSYVFGASFLSCLRCEFVDNRGASNAGVVFRTSSALVSFDSCTFRRNSAPLGGALYATERVVSGLSFVVKNSTFVGNAANIGAALYVQGAMTISFDSNRFVANVVRHFGVVYVSVGQSISFVDATFDNHTNIDSVLILEEVPSDAFLCVRCLFTNSRTSSSAVRVSYGADVSFVNLTFSNVASDLDAPLRVSDESSIIRIVGLAATNCSGRTAGFADIQTATTLDLADAAIARCHGGTGAVRAAGALNLVRVEFDRNRGTFGGAVWLESSKTCGVNFKAVSFNFNDALPTSGQLYFSLPAPCLGVCAARTSCVFVGAAKSALGLSVSSSPSLMRLTPPSKIYPGIPFVLSSRVLDAFGNPLDPLRFEMSASLHLRNASADVSVASDPAAVDVAATWVFTNVTVFSAVSSTFCLTAAVTPAVEVSDACATVAPCPPSMKFSPDSRSCEPDISTLPLASFATFLAFVTFFFLAFALTAALLLYYRNVTIIRASSPFFSAITISGGALCLIAAAMAMSLHVHTDQHFAASTCRAMPWVLGYGFIFLFGSLATKTYRVYILFVRSSLRRIVLTNSRLFRVVLVMSFLEAVLNALWSSLAPLDAERLFDPIATVFSIECVVTNSLFLSLWAGYKILLLLLGLFFAISTRNVHTQYNESRSISFSIYNIVVLAAICSIFLFAVQGTPPPSTPPPPAPSTRRPTCPGQFLLKTVFVASSLVICSVVCVASTYVPKLYTLWRQFVKNRGGNASQKVGFIDSILTVDDDDKAVADAAPLIEAQNIVVAIKAALKRNQIDEAEGLIKDLYERSKQKFEPLSLSTQALEEPLAPAT